MAGSKEVNPCESTVRQDCTALSIAFANAIDHRDYSRVLSLFTADGILERWDQTFRGLPEIAAMLEARPTETQTRHFCTNIEITARLGGEITGITYFLFFRENGAGSASLPLNAPKMVGEYHDIFRLTELGWRIAQRSIKVVFQ